MKKTVCIILAATVLFSLLFAVSVSADGDEAQVDLENGYLIFVDEGAYCILKDCAENTEGDVVIPSDVDFGGKSLPVKKIKSDAFSNCYTVTGITIPDCVTEIGDWAFYQCFNLKKITIPANVETIGVDLFYGCISLDSINVDAKNKKYSSYDGVLFNKNRTELIAYPNAKGSDYTIPDGVSTIGYGAFESCYDLSGVTIPESVNMIDDYAFNGCNNMENIFIPVNVSYIGKNVFAGCNVLEKISVDEKNLCYTSLDGVLFDKDIKQIVAYPAARAEKYVIPDGVDTIMCGAFSYCYSLRSVTIPDSVTMIDSWAFSNCSSLSAIKIPDSVTYLGASAFSGCTSLLSVTVPNGITKIYDETFFRCESLASVTLPATLTSVGGAAFLACDSLKTVYFKGTEEQWNSITFDWGNEVINDVKAVFDYTGAGAGDVNGDGEVDNKDVVTLFRFVSAAADGYDAAYDLNEDGEVNNKDVVELFRYVSLV